jgi:hypothetical protein
MLGPVQINIDQRSRASLGEDIDRDLLGGIATTPVLQMARNLVDADFVNFSGELFG